MLTVSFVLIGGPFDGKRGLGWSGGSAQRPPHRIGLWRCEGRGACAPVWGDASLEPCQGAHVCWIEAEHDRAPGSAAGYVQVSLLLSRHEGIARYVYDGVDQGALRAASRGATLKREREVVLYG